MSFSLLKIDKDRGEPRLSREDIIDGRMNDIVARLSLEFGLIETNMPISGEW
jgi:hypothetical protein